MKNISLSVGRKIGLMCNTELSANFLTELISKNVKKAQREEIFFEEIYSNPHLLKGKNEFLFFIKPEITCLSQNIQFENIITLIQSKIKDFGLVNHNTKILTAKYLAKYNIIAQHYGIINSISSNAILNLSESAIEKFKELYSKSIQEVTVLGAFEFLNQYAYAGFNVNTLDYLWQNLENTKLSSGTYCEKIKIDNKFIYLINGFHPRQLNHFIENGRSIIVMTLSGNLSWSEARNNFIGATNPLLANEGSLRRLFLEKKSELGISEVSQGVNGVHLSAGPIEALIELKRFNSNFSSNSLLKDFSDFSFGVDLQEHFTKEQFEDIIANKNIISNGKRTSVFDLTEDKDSPDALCILKNFFY